MLRMDVVDSFDRLVLRLRNAEFVVDGNPPDDENVAFQLDLAYAFRCELSV